LKIDRREERKRSSGELMARRREGKRATRKKRLLFTRIPRRKGWIAYLGEKKKGKLSSHEEKKKKSTSASAPEEERRDFSTTSLGEEGGTLPLRGKDGETLLQKEGKKRRDAQHQGEKEVASLDRVKEVGTLPWRK